MVEVQQLSEVLRQGSKEPRVQTLRRMFNYRNFGPSNPRLAAVSPLVGATADPGTATVPPENIMDIIHKGQKAPGQTSVLAVPPSLSDMDMQNLQDISLLDTYVSVGSALDMYNNNPKGFDITTPDGAAFFTRTLANARLRVLTQGLAGFLSLSDSVATSYAKSTTSADLHLEFLSQIFSGFNFTPAAMKQLDGLMTNIVSSLGALQASWSDESQTLDHMISVYYFEPVMGLSANVPKLSLFFLHVDQKSWTASIGKSSITHFQFNMNYSNQIGTMSLTQMAAINDPSTGLTNRQVLQNHITDMTNQSLDSIQKLVAMTAADQADSK